MFVPVTAALHCSDGPYGHVCHLLVNAHGMRLSHLAAIGPGVWPVERLIPVSAIADSTPALVVLRYTRQELDRMIARVEMGAALGMSFRGDLRDLGLSLVFPEETSLTVPRELLLPGEVALHKYTLVTATDGPVGHVDGLLAEPRWGAITHLALREGHVWHRREVVLPAPDIARFEADAVRLALTKGAVAALAAGAATR